MKAEIGRFWCPWMTSEHESILVQMWNQRGTPHRAEDFNLPDAHKLLRELEERGMVNPRWGTWSFSGKGLRYVLRYLVDNSEYA